MKVKCGAWKNDNLSSCFHCGLVSSPISSLLFINVVDGIVILQLFVLLQVSTITSIEFYILYFLLIFQFCTPFS